MWYLPESFAALASLIFLAPADATISRHVVAPTALTRAARIAACDAPALSLPRSIQLADGLQPIVRSALEHSPTFRQQCRVLAAAPRLAATVRVSFMTAGIPTRALTSFRQNQWGTLVADIEIRSAADMTELLAHEFEHLIEQLDGVDLATVARAGDAHRLDGGAFETQRAIAAGLRVSGEVVDNSPDRVRRASGSVWRVLRRAVRASAAVR